MTNQMTMEKQSGGGMEERLHGLETGQAVQAAAVAGMEAAQTAAMAGAQATQAAIQAGNIAAMVTASAAFVVGMFLGLAIAANRRGAA